MPIHECLNFTPFAVALGFCQDVEGADLAVAVLKATFRFGLGGVLVPAEKEALVPVFKTDVFFGAPDDSSLRYATDFVPTKPGTDIAVNGHVYGRQRARVTAGFELAGLSKRVEAIGARTWIVAPGAVRMTEPRPFESVPLRYEEAFGGTDVDTAGSRHVFEDNPIGTGFIARPRHGAALPRLEDPTRLVCTVSDRPPPASLGFIPTGARQRVRWAGTFDAAWERSRRPLFPADFDERFFNAVPQDQVLRRRPEGGERLVLHNLHPTAPRLALELPRARFAATFHVREDVRTVPMEADTLLVEPDQARLAMSFRATYRLDFDVRYVKSVMFKEVQQ